jgi:hypothetical protein
VIGMYSSFIVVIFYEVCFAPTQTRANEAMVP